jgi:hypothetical protein
MNIYDIIPLNEGCRLKEWHLWKDLTEIKSFPKPFLDYGPKTIA